MNTTIGVFDTHEKAIDAVQELKRAGFPVQQVSLIGKAVIIDDLMRVRSRRGDKNMPLMIGAILGPVLGILTGVKLFAIPGLGILYGTGAIMGALAGFSIGLVLGGIPALFATLLDRGRAVLKYKERVVERGFQVIVHGTSDDAMKAKAILAAHIQPDK